MTHVTLEFSARKIGHLLGAVAAVAARSARVGTRLEELATRLGSVATRFAAGEDRIGAVAARIGGSKAGPRRRTRFEGLASRFEAAETRHGAAATRIVVGKTPLGRLEEALRSLRACEEAPDRRVREMTADGKLTLAVPPGRPSRSSTSRAGA